MTDPRSSIKSLLAAQIVDANLTKDDGVTQLSWHSLFEPYSVHVKRIFIEKTVDLIFGIADASPAVTRLGVSHVGTYRVTAYAIDKWSGGSKIITATLVLWKAVKELRRVFKENPWGSMRSFVEDRIEVHDFGSVQIWSKPCTVEYKTYSS